MRKAFIDTLTRLASRDRRIVFLTADLGFTVVEPFAEAHPDRFFNVGVAEQNMVGMATGLAEAGFIPFLYSIVSFMVLRPFEFIRNGPVLHHLPVRIVGVGGGFEYGCAGHSHHGLEDLGVMRTLPNLEIIAPADAQQAEQALRATWDLPGPIYYRLGRDETTRITGLEGRFERKRAHRVRAGRDLVLITVGAIAREAVGAAELLAAEGIEAGVVVVSSVQPAPVDDLRDALTAVRLALTVEAHSINGGLGSMVCETVAEHSLGTRVARCGVLGPPPHSVGGERFLLERHGLTAAALAARARASLIACSE